MSDALRSGFDIGSAVMARAREFATSAGLPSNATRAQLLTALARRRVIVPAMRPGFDDTDDLVDALRRIPDKGLLAPAAAGWRAIVPVMPGRQPRYTIRVHAVLCSDSDGKNAPAITDAELTKLFIELSNVYTTAGLGFTYTKSVVKNTFLNQDFTVPKDADMTSTAKPMTDSEITASFKAHNTFRSDWARKHHTGQLVVFFRYGTSLRWDDTAMKWVVDHATHAFSGGEHEFVAMNQGTVTEDSPLAKLELMLMAHEMGHYFHLPHTHSEAARLTTAEQALYPDPEHNQADRENSCKLARKKAIEAIRTYVDVSGHPPEQGLNVFDGDSFSDTAPDPSGQIFYYEFANACSLNSIALDVPLKTGVRKYTLDPDRDLIMSYFFRCSGAKRFSEQQIDRIRQSLETKTPTPTGLSRNHLIAPKYRSSGLGFLTQWLPWRKSSPVPSVRADNVSALVRRADA